LIEVKANLQRYISRIILFIKTAVSINNSLDPGPQALAGLHHGVPVEDPSTSFIFWIRSLILLRDFSMTHTSDLPHTKY
jgi:hypothetical protein